MDRRNFIATAFLLGGVSWVIPAGAEERELLVIVHPKSPIDSVSASELLAIFTTRKRDWDGMRLIPLNFPPRETHRVQFDRSVLGMSPEEVGRYWIDRKVRGGNAPPKHVSSMKLMLGAVAKLREAIGYIPSDELTKKVRVVASVRDGKVHGV